MICSLMLGCLHPEIGLHLPRVRTVLTFLLTWNQSNVFRGTVLQSSPSRETSRRCKIGTVSYHLWIGILVMWSLVTSSMASLFDQSWAWKALEKGSWSADMLMP